jgi:hypothetical protein
MVGACILRAINTFPALEALALAANTFTMLHAIRLAIIGARAYVALCTSPAQVTRAGSLVAGAVTRAGHHSAGVQFTPLSKEACVACALATMAVAVSGAVELAHINAAILASQARGAFAHSTHTLSLVVLRKTVVRASVLIAI